MWTPLQRIHLLNEFLASHGQEYLDVGMWQRLVGEFFAPDAFLALALPGADEPVHVVGRALIPRFFLAWAEGGLSSLSLLVDRLRETFLPLGMLLLDSDRVRLLSTLDHGQQLVEHSGAVRILFAPTAKVQLLELRLAGFEHFVNSKTDNLFTLPIRGGFSPAVHQFLGMQQAVQAAFARLEGPGSPLPGMLHYPIPVHVLPRP